jgi:hypothetical protein
MQHWRFSRIMFSLIAVLVMVVSLNVLGCGGGDDGGEEIHPEAAQLANRTFLISDAALFDTAMAGQPVVLRFGDDDQNTVPFSITGLRDDQNNPVAIQGDGVVGSVAFFINTIVVNQDSISSVVIGGKTFVVNLVTAAFVLDLTVETDANGNLIFHFSNPANGVFFNFLFKPGETSSTGTTGSGGE